MVCLDKQVIALSTFRRGFGWLAASLLALAMACAGAAHAQAPGSPEALVKKVTDDVLNAIKSDPAVQSGNPRRLLQLVDEKILPYVNFEKTTRLAAGRYWRQATPEQQQALVKEFRTTLVRTYSGAVSAVKQQTAVELLPSRYPADATDVVVRTVIKQPSGDPVPVDYRMEKDGQGWKIYDVNVLGVWLIENYRNQFSQQISQGGIDGLIKSLAERNRQFEN
jgi:ABC-type transport system involved in resistance to organic solvents, auxiliary component